mgnify:CR=1 FL=1
MWSDLQQVAAAGDAEDCVRILLKAENGRLADVQIGGGTCNTLLINITTQATGATTPVLMEMRSTYQEASGRYTWDCVQTGGEPQHVPSTCRT